MDEVNLLERALYCLRRSVMFARLDGDEERAAKIGRGIEALTHWDPTVFEAILAQAGLPQGKVQRLRISVEVPELKAIRMTCARELRRVGDDAGAERVAAWGTCSDLVEIAGRLRARAEAGEARGVAAAVEAVDALAEVLGYAHKVRERG